MTNPVRAWTHNERLILFAFIFLAVFLRAGAALFLGDQVVDLPGTADQISYHTLALRVLDGHGFTFGQDWWPATGANEPTAHWSYLYTGFLAAVYALFGPHPLAARLIQAVLAGTLHPYLAYLLGRRLFSRSIGLLAAGLTAVYIYFVYYAANLMTESFYILAILASLYLAIRMANAGSASMGSRVGAGLALGVSLAAAVLLRQVFLLFIPFLFLWVLLSGFRRQFPILVLSGLVILAAILPFTAYNYARFDRFVLLNTNAGFAFFWGNHPIYGTHFIPILPSGQYQELIPPEFHTLDEAALDQALLARALGFIRADPGRYLLLSLSRIPEYFKFWPSPESSTLSNISRVLSFGIFWPFMLYGLALSLLRRPSPLHLNPPSPLLLIYLFIGIYSAIHILTWTLIRYRLPVDAVLILFAALALVNLAAKLPAVRRLFGLGARKTSSYPEPEATGHA